MDNVELVVIEEVRKVCFRSVSLDEDLFDSAGLDSLGMVDLVVALESRLNIQIAATEIDMATLRSARLISNFVKLRIKKKQNEI